MRILEYYEAVVVSGVFSITQRGSSRRSSFYDGGKIRRMPDGIFAIHYPDRVVTIVHSQYIAFHL